MEVEKPVAAVMRSVLFVPSTVERFVERAPHAGADAVCLDLEDSIPPDEKAKARLMAAKAIGSMDRVGYLTLVRVNGLDTGLLEDDVLAVVRPGLNGILLPKADSAEAVKKVDNYLTILERERELEVGTIAIVPLIETALGIVNCYAICTASPRLVGACLGAEDLATDMRVKRSRGGEEVQWARAQLAIAAQAAGLIPLDTPDPDYSDLEHLEREASLARSLGYQGKLCIHPNQVPVVNRVFSPTDAEIAEARAVVERFEQEGIARGRAAIPIDGKMVDTPVYWRAKRLMEWAESARSAVKE